MRLSGLMFALASTVLASCVASTPLAAQDTIKIGSSNSMTGPNAFLGLASTRGAEMAIEAINAAGGIGGKKLEFIVRDDEHDPVKLVANYRQLVERDGVVAMIGGSNSASMLAVTPLVNDQLKVPVICPQTDATAITENDAWKEKRDNYMFRLAMYGHGQANFLVDSMVKKFGYKKVGLLTWTAGWGVTGRGELNRRLSELGLKPVADETYDTSDTDPTPQILKLRNAGAEVIINYGLVRENTFIAKTRVKLDDHTPYASAWGLAVPAFWTAAGNAAEGMLTSVTFTIDGPQPADRIAVINAYHKKYGPEFDAPLA